MDKEVNNKQNRVAKFKKKNAKKPAHCPNDSLDQL